jgi:hypothetical protein
MAPRTPAVGTSHQIKAAKAEEAAIGAELARMRCIEIE